MVQIIPPQTNLGSQIGQSLGQGLQQGLNQAIQQQYQRGMLQKALGKVRELGNQENADPVALMTSLMEAGAGIPGSERYIGALAPLLLGNLRTKQLYGEGEKASGEESLQPAAAFREASKFVEGEKPAGYLAAPMNPEQMQAYAERYANVMQTPEAYDQGFSQAQRINQERLQSRQALQQAAVAQGITPDEMPRFMQSATEFQELNDLPAIERAAVDKTKQIRNQKEALRNINAPGSYQNLGGIKQHFIPGMTLFKALTSKGKERQEALKGYSSLVKNLVNEGEEPYVRETLAKEIGLSPTEIEELIHPITEGILKNISKLPKGNQMNPKARKESLINFFRNNVGNDTSLLVLRDNLINEKGYDWKEILEAIHNAFPDGNSLTKYQQAEESALAQPPIQSLSQLFSPTPNLRGFLRGQK